MGTTNMYVHFIWFLAILFDVPTFWYDNIKRTPDFRNGTPVMDVSSLPDELPLSPPVFCIYV